MVGRRTLVVAAGSLLVSSLTIASERRIKKSEVPGAVLSAVATRYPTADLKSFAEEVDKGKKVYEVQLLFDRRTIDTTFSSDGRMIVEERVIARTDLPEAVQKSLTASKWGKWDILRIERIEESDKPAAATFELLVRHAAKRTELVYSQTGDLTKKESKTRTED